MNQPSSSSGNDNNNMNVESDNQNGRRNEREDNNPRAGAQARPSIAPMEDTSRKERRIMTKSIIVTLPTLLQGHDLYFDRTITLHKFILSAQLIQIITPSNLNEKLPWYAQKNGQSNVAGQAHYHRFCFLDLYMMVLMKMLLQWIPSL